MAAEPTVAPGGAGSRSRAQIAQRLQRSVGRLSTAAMSRMEHETPWVAELSAQDRSLIGMIVQAGIRAFVEWYRDPAKVSVLRAQVFGAAPRAFAGVITLHQTVDLVRLSIEVVEQNLASVVGEEDVPHVREAINSYAREVAFATAEVYALAAEQRGAWDARLEALVVDAVLRGQSEGDESEELASRASALGWRGTGHVVVVVGNLGEGTALEEVRRFAHEEALDCLCAAQGSRLVVVLGGVDASGSKAAYLADAFAEGPVVVGPVVAGLAEAGASAEAALAGLRAVDGRAAAPRPVSADDLLPERALNGDDAARDRLVSEFYQPLVDAGATLVETVAYYVERGGSVEATARALFVHPNTVRYRLRRCAEVTGLSPHDSRDAFALRLALTLGRLASGPAGHHAS